MSELAAFFLAGLALFFSGLGGIKSNLQQLGNRRFRVMLARVTNHPLLALPVGIVFGATTQSASAVAFILSGMITTGMLQVRQALPVLAASNLGTVVLVFLAAINLKIAILYLIGLAGICIAFNLGGAKTRPILQTLFSVGLLFYGLDMMKLAFAPLPKYAWFSDLAAFLASWSIAPFVLGLFLRVLIQSSSAISVIAITLVQGGIFDDFQAGMLMAGAGPGVGLATYLLSTNLSGVARQIVYFQAIINAVAGVIIALLLTLEKFSSIPLLTAATGLVTSAEDTHLALVFLIMMALTFATGMALLPFSTRLLDRLAPATVEEDLGKPHFILDEALALPETALDLARKEQLRYAGYIPKLIDGLLPETERVGAPPPDVIQTGTETLGREISSFLAELSHGEHNSALGTPLLALIRRQETLGQLSSTLFRFVQHASQENSSEILTALISRLAESLNTILTTLVDTLADPGELDIEFLCTMTADRGDLMERIRKSYLENPEISSFADRSTLSYATTLFDRCVWLANQIASELREGRPA